MLVTILMLAAVVTVWGLLMALNLKTMGTLWTVLCTPDLAQVWKGFEFLGGLLGELFVALTRE